ncbi:MAG TPA: T9SS type A sorting domain-containing protein [Bacteroidia bacterium]|nr:T9SS type A sorting domain-containing protein [Bacteroidia bacterium]HMU20065.1 T9SS type A sorting domain-containing protein [Bacteroidia bacterium]
MKKIALLLFVMASQNAWGQNLVLNPSFEDTIPCSIFQNNNYPQMPCTGWYWASGGSCDYFSEQYLCISSPAPYNGWGWQYPKTGVAYCGFALFTNFSPQFNNYREYLGGQLIDTLKQGHTYCVSFYVVNADSGKYYTSNIGMYLSPDSSVDYSTALNLPYIPQIINTNGIIYDTLNWTQISGNYIAGGGEKYFIIGNFNNDANTTLDSNTQTNLAYASSYYYIDDVSVVDCTVGINEIESYKNKISLMPNPAKGELRISPSLTLPNGAGTIVTQIQKLEITDVLGNVVLIESVKSDEKNIKINVSNFTKGVYFVKVFSDKGIAIKKFIKE